MSRERDHVTTLPSNSTSSGRVDREVERDATERIVAEQIEEHAGRAIGQAIRSWLGQVVGKAIRVIGMAGGGAVLGATGANYLNEDTPVATNPAPASGPAPATAPPPGQPADVVPPSLLVPPASQDIRDACEQAGEEARRAILDARLCVDAFSDAARACDYFPARHRADQE